MREGCVRTTRAPRCPGTGANDGDGKMVKLDAWASKRLLAGVDDPAAEPEYPNRSESLIRNPLTARSR